MSHNNPKFADKAGHVADFAFMPSAARRSVMDATPRITTVLAKCQGCPWHAKFPEVWRMFLVPTEMVEKGEIALGKTITMFHHKREEWWGNWKPVAIGTRSTPESEVSVKGVVPKELPKQTIWTVMPVPPGPAAEPAETDKKDK